MLGQGWFDAPGGTNLYYVLGRFVDVFQARYILKLYVVCMSSAIKGALMRICGMCVTVCFFCFMALGCATTSADSTGGSVEDGHPGALVDNRIAGQTGDAVPAPSADQAVRQAETPAVRVLAGNAAAKAAFAQFDATGALPASGFARPAAALPDHPYTILVPPQSVVTWETDGNCLDPDLPAPRGGDVFQFVPMRPLVQPDLLPLFRRFMILTKTDPQAEVFQQEIVWAILTVGDRHSLCDQLTPEYNALLDRALPAGAQLLARARAEHRVRFAQEPEEHAPPRDERPRRERRKPGPAEALSTLLGMASSANFNKMLSPEGVLNEVMRLTDTGARLQRLQSMPIDEPLRNDGYEYGEVAPGVYSHVVGTKPLAMKLRLANTTTEPYIFDPLDFAAQAQRKTQRVGLSLPDPAR